MYCYRIHTKTYGLSMYAKCGRQAIHLLWYWDIVLGSMGTATSTGDRHKTDRLDRGSRGRCHLHTAAHDTITLGLSVWRLASGLKTLVGKSIHPKPL